MAPNPAHFFSVSAELLRSWRGEAVWRVLDTGFGEGEAFFGTWQAWADDPQRPRLLHYVAVTPTAPEIDAVLWRMRAFPALGLQCADVQRSWFGLLPGFHRIVLQQDQVLLTLCIGSLPAMLREQQFVADWVRVAKPPSDAPPGTWDRWCIKTLARLCRRGTGVQMPAVSTQLHGELSQAGFVLDNSAQRALSGPAMDVAEDLIGRYQPHWEPGASRHRWRHRPPPVSSCVVVGAGLAGATVAAALARRGWQVLVLDSAAEPAAGASGLPLGLLAPHLSRDDSSRSRLSRAGVRATLQLCHRLLRQGQDWACSGALELRLDGAPGLPDHWPAAGRLWSDNGHTQAGQSGWPEGSGTASVWHAAAGWIKPACLVQACLAQSGVTFAGRSAVHSLSRNGSDWVVRDAAGVVLAQAPHVVVAAAVDSVRLLNAAADALRQSNHSLSRLANMEAIGGQVSWGMQHSGDTDVFPPFPVNGSGSFVAHVPMQDAKAWFAGATYLPLPADRTRECDGHGENLQRLSSLLPIVARKLASRFSGTQIRAWTGTRCTTHDRLPAVGPLEDRAGTGLWVSSGMGSRGLTYSALCAEVLAAQLGAEPLPVEASLAKCIAATRPQLRAHQNP